MTSIQRLFSGMKSDLPPGSRVLSCKYKARALIAMCYYAVFACGCFGALWVIAYVYALSGVNSLPSEQASLLTAAAALIALCFVVPFKIESNKPLGSGVALAILWTMTLLLFNLGQNAAMVANPHALAAIALLVNIAFMAAFGYFVCLDQD
jgi:hypothetical protein